MGYFPLYIKDHIVMLLLNIQTSLEARSD